jgi:hypothetical protein
MKKLFLLGISLALFTGKDIAETYNLLLGNPDSNS